MTSKTSHVRLLLTAAAAAIPFAPAAAETPMNLFDRACLQGEVRMAKGEASEVGFARLPEAVMLDFKRPKEARVWRMADGVTYLYVFDNADKRGNMTKVCGVASRDLDIDKATAALDRRLAGTVDETNPRKATQWLRPHEGYVVTVTPKEDYVVAQIDWLNGFDRKIRARQIDIVNN